MMFATPCEEYVVSPTIARAMDRILTLHADHEQNASTSTVRLAGSSGANPFACIAAGIASLWGPAHGGANEAVLKMLNEIGDVKNIPEYVKKAKDKDDPFRLMGFGHRVYKNFDPRATLMRETCHEVLKRTRHHGRAAARTGHGAGKRSRSKTTISSNGDSIRTSTSIPASSSKRSVFRNRCSRCCSPSRAQSAGCPVERDDRGPRSEDRTPQTALYRRNRTRFRRPGQALIKKKPASSGVFYAVSVPQDLSISSIL